MMMVDDASILGKPDWPKPVCHCLPGCSEINYASSLTYESLDPQFLAMSGYGTDLNVSAYKSNLAVVHLFFTETQFLNYYKTELIGVSDFLSTRGGLLGLFLGFSFISAVEIFYFLVVDVLGKMFKRHHKTTTNAAPSRNTLPFLK